jgi:hypothetical protein
MPAVCVTGVGQDEPYGVAVRVEQQQDVLVADGLAVGAGLGNGVTVEEDRQ